MAAENSNARRRLFVAIPAPEAVRAEMLRVQRELEPFAPRNVVRWTKPEQFHLTLKFLGDVPANQVEALQKSVLAACGNCPALRLRAQDIGFFPNDRSPRVIWAGVNDAENRLPDLQKEIGRAVRHFVEKPGAENFAGHLTLGRFKSFRRRGVEEIVRRAAAIPDRLFGEWTAEEVELVQSDLSPSEARHTRLAAFRLCGAAEAA